MDASVIDLTFTSVSARDGESVNLPVHIATAGAPVVLFALTAPSIHPEGHVGMDVYSLGWEGVRDPRELASWLRQTLELLESQDFDTEEKEN